MYSEYHVAIFISVDFLFFFQKDFSEELSSAVSPLIFLTWLYHINCFVLNSSTVVCCTLISAQVFFIQINFYNISVKKCLHVSSGRDLKQWVPILKFRFETSRSMHSTLIFKNLK